MTLAVRTARIETHFLLSNLIIAVTLQRYWSLVFLLNVQIAEHDLLNTLVACVKTKALPLARATHRHHGEACTALAVNRSKKFSCGCRFAHWIGRYISQHTSLQHTASSQQHSSARVQHRHHKRLYSRPQHANLVSSTTSGPLRDVVLLLGILNWAACKACML